jgi:hypothetical protein
MSSVSETVLVKDKPKKIGKTGNTAAIYVPSEVKEYLRIGDNITLDVVIVGNQLKFVVSKPLYNFGIVDIQKLSADGGFKTDYHKMVGDVTVFEATKDNLTLSYTQNRGDGIQPAHVIVSKKLTSINHNKYDNILSLASKLKKNFDVVVRPEGDLDAINVLKEPKRYKLTKEKAFTLLEKAGKKVGTSITCRFDSKKNNIEEIKNAIDELSKLNS